MQNSRTRSRYTSFGANSTRNKKSFNTSSGRGGRSFNRQPRRKFGSTIHPSKFVKTAKPVEQTVYEPTHTFEDFTVDARIKNNLAKNNYVKPSQIQDQAIPLGLAGKDIVGIANTGTGKTAAFLIPALNSLIQNKHHKLLVMAPTRELAQQIQDQSRWLSKGCGIYDTLLIGGMPIGRQIRELSRHPRIIIGTPGRIKDHLSRGTLTTKDIKIVVLDEVDRMLDMGFYNDIKDVLVELPEQKQSLYFSATITNTIEDLIRGFTYGAEKIMARTAETSDNVEQSVMHYESSEDKMEKLHELLISEQVEKSIIFCETKRDTDKLSKELNVRGFKSESIHGNKTQGQRQRALNSFKDDRVNILVATDVAARGIDVSDISHVINYEIPQTYDDYTHRIGRTGRGDKTGSAITFVKSR
jgi:superfamily II DNA/RNA helicase